MADFDTTFETGSTDNENRKRRRGPSILLLLSAIAALLISGWALIGPFIFDFASLDLGWVLVATAVVVGLVLVVLPGRRSNSQ